MHLQFILEILLESFISLTSHHIIFDGDPVKPLDRDLGAMDRLALKLLRDALD